MPPLRQQSAEPVQYNQPGLIDRVRPDLTISRYTLPTTVPVGHRIISGPDGSMWFSELAVDIVGSVTTGCPTPTTPMSWAGSVSRGRTSRNRRNPLTVVYRRAQCVRRPAASRTASFGSCGRVAVDGRRRCATTMCPNS